jgi:hypothetical protein
MNDYDSFSYLITRQLHSLSFSGRDEGEAEIIENPLLEHLIRLSPGQSFLFDNFV